MMKLRLSLFSITFVLISLTLHSTNRYTLDDYFNQLGKASVYRMKQKHKLFLKNYFYQHRLGPKRTLDNVDQARENFERKRATLIAEWAQSTKLPWPIYKKDTLCKINGKCYWKEPGHLYDAHHIFPLSHYGPDSWWNLWPLTSTQHTSIHTGNGPCCTIFPKSCGKRGGDIEADPKAFLQGWKITGKTQSRSINGENACITKVQQTKSKHYYRVSVAEKSLGKSFQTLAEAKKQAILKAFSK